METSLFLAKLIGVTYLALGLGVLLNGAYYQKLFKEFLGNAMMYLWGGMMALIIGLAIVLHHNVWEKSWVVIVTLFGWIALVKGVFFLVAPKAVKEMSSFWTKSGMMTFVGVFALILGAVLGYFGFFA